MYAIAARLALRYRHCDLNRQGLSMGAADRIELNPKIMLGKPVIRGTRITVELILRKIAEGADDATLLAAYPHLTREDIQAALIFAADTLAHETNIELAVRP
jgi:uncharacterized protein (DUF433 family)